MFFFSNLILASHGHKEVSRSCHVNCSYTFWFFANCMFCVFVLLSMLEFYVVFSAVRVILVLLDPLHMNWTFLVAIFIS